MGSHAVFLAQRARASPFLYAAFRVLTAAWKRKEETLPPQSPRAHEGPRGAMQRPCGQCRVSPTSPPSPPSPRRLGGDGPQAGTSASIAAAASPPRRWGGGGGRSPRPAGPGPADHFRRLSTASDTPGQPGTQPGGPRARAGPFSPTASFVQCPSPAGGPRRLAEPSCDPQLCRTASGLAHPVGGGPGRCARAAAWPRHSPAAELVNNPASGRPTRGGRAGSLRAAWARTRSSWLSRPGLASSCTPCSRGSLLPGSGKRKRFLLSPRGPSWARGGSCCALPSLPSPPRPGGECLRAGSSASIAAAASLPPQMEGGWRSPRPAGPGPADHFRHRSAPEAHPLAAVADFSTPTVGLGLALVPPGGG